jgi:hypothetical protein
VIDMHLRGELRPWSADGGGGSGGCTSSAHGHGKHAQRERGSKSSATIVQLRRRGPRD